MASSERASSASGRVLFVGNVCVDIWIPPHEPPPPGGITVVPPLDLQIGGNAANSAVVAARLGVPTAVAGTLGDDVFGRWIRETLAAEGVDVESLHLTPGERSPTTLVRNDASGERAFVHHPGTNETAGVPEAAVRGDARVVHLAGVELLAGVWPRAAEVARRAREAGCTVTLDPFVDPSGDPRIIEEHREVLGEVDVFFPNEVEARILSGADDPDRALDRFHELGVRVVALKLGARGAIVSSVEGWRERTRPPRVEVLDTCGAGDSFAAGYIAGMLAGDAPASCARRGCALGALCVAHRGALTGSSDPERLRGALDALATDG